ncbi:hypothetical protein EI74_0209 [Mycoplasma testudineum]|uniref:Phosphoesterase n=2 Tax=Mycoplasma testudineum TaxID=244584 RepID=A0A4R6IH69_9MOLU|nr:YfcE family phosphodiesterase [Mycoplasma testudineum]TDO21178.1 hypothetical protein EI74_0209 [Mycoplasma testudineum]
MIKILIMSDIHNFDTVAKKIIEFENADLVISAGDNIVNQTFMIKYFDYFVDGNNDIGLNPEEIDFEFSGFNFHIEHGHLIGYNKLMNVKAMQEIANKHSANFFITGHSHVPLIVETKNGLAINPGSIVLARYDSDPGYVILKIDKQTNKYEYSFMKSERFLNGK